MYIATLKPDTFDIAGPGQIQHTTDLEQYTAPSMKTFTDMLVRRCKRQIVRPLDYAGTHNRAG